MSIKLRTLILCVLFSCALSKSLRLCHTNDFHAKYLEVGESNARCQSSDSVKGKCYSGIARLAGAFKQFECDVKIQAGDWVQGSMLDYLFKEDIAIDAYKWVKYDFAAFGNHEFDLDNSHIIINKTIFSTSDITTWISSNVFFDGMDDMPIHRWVDQYDICWVSSLTKETSTLSKLEPNIRIESEDESLRKYIGHCKNRNNVIAITHQGYENDLATCRNVAEIDLIIGGHSHTNLDNGQYPVKVSREDGSVCWVTTAYAHGRYVGIMDIEFDNGGVLQMKSSAYIAMDHRIKPDPEVLSKVMIYDEQMAQKAEEKIGAAEEDIIGGTSCGGPVEVPEDGSDIRGECQMGNMICDAMLSYKYATVNESTPRICLMNGGTIRNSFAIGTVTLHDLVNVCPFGNTMVSIVMTGWEVMDVLNHAFSSTATNNRGAFPGGLGNIKIRAHMDGSKPNGKKVSIEKVFIGDEPLEPDGKYEMLTNSYAADGGDGYVFPEKQNDLEILIRDTLGSYVREHSPVLADPAIRIAMSATATQNFNDALTSVDQVEVGIPTDSLCVA